MVRLIEINGHRRLQLVVAVVGMRTARLLRMGMNIDGHQLVDVHETLPDRAWFPALEHIDTNAYSGTWPTSAAGDSDAGDTAKLWNVATARAIILPLEQQTSRATNKP
jgi:hypothetical protein